MSRGYVFMVSFTGHEKLLFAGYHPHGWSGFAEESRAAGSQVDTSLAVLEFEHWMEEPEQFYHRFASCPGSARLEGCPGYFLDNIDSMIGHLFYHLVSDMGGRIRAEPDSADGFTLQALVDLVPIPQLTMYVAAYVCEQLGDEGSLEVVNEAITQALCDPVAVTGLTDSDTSGFSHRSHNVH